jgi:hypothetical protein
VNFQQFEKPLLINNMLRRERRFIEFDGFFQAVTEILSAQSGIRTTHALPD